MGMKPVKGLGILMVVSGLSACATPTWMGKAFGRNDAQQTTVAHSAALTVGQQACRSVPVGFAEHRIMQGQVTAVTDQQVSVRVEEGSDSALLVDGQVVQPNSIVTSDAGQWTPCTP